MIKKINTRSNITNNQSRCPVVYYPIDNNDYESIRFYENNGYTVKTISLNGNPHCFAFIPVETQEQARRINQAFIQFYLQEQDSFQLRMDNEISFDKMSDIGYDSTVNHNDPATILENLATMKALFYELDSLTDEEYHICQMIGSNVSESEMAAELNIPYKELHKCKQNLLKRLKHQLKGYR